MTKLLSRHEQGALAINYLDNSVYIDFQVYTTVINGYHLIFNKETIEKQTLLHNA